MAIFIFPLKRILGRWYPEPLPAAGTFDGQRVLITGGTAGMGLAAATHYASLGAEVYITSRNASRGQAAKQQIEGASTYRGDGEKCTVLELDMNSYESCTALVADCRKRFSGDGGLDIAVLNAGSVGPIYTKSKEGWEQTIQVNALSTVLLGLLFGEWFKEERANRDTLARMIFVTSRSHLYPSIKQWPQWAANEGILNRLSDEKHWPSIWVDREPNYGASKLLAHYGIEEILKRSLGSDGEPQYVLNTVCPGLVHSNIASGISGYGLYWKMCVSIYMLIGGKTTDSGSRIAVNAALLPKEQHGQFVNTWLTQEQYNRISHRVLGSKEGRQMQAASWKEMFEELRSKVPAVQKLEA